MALPSAFQAADTASLEGQRVTAGSVRWALIMGLIAAAAGVFTWRVGDADLDLMAGLGVIAFLAALAFTFVSTRESARDRWYQGRALAESVKTMAWRYAVCGEPFATDQANVDTLFLDQLQQVLDEATIAWPPSTDRGQITDDMRRSRAGTLDERRATYLEHRVEDQRKWYAARASHNTLRAKQWFAVTVAANVFGVAGAFLRFLDLTDVDLLGLAAALAGSATAWSHLRQHQSLATSYAFAAQELAIIHDRLRVDVSEQRWAANVAVAEEAISREHTLWLARRSPSLRAP